MTTAEKTLLYLTENPGIYLSGEVLANKIGVSRNSVWKAIKSYRSRHQQRLPAVFGLRPALSGWNPGSQWSHLGIRQHFTLHKYHIERAGCLKKTPPWHCSGMRAANRRAGTVRPELLLSQRYRSVYEHFTPSPAICTGSCKSDSGGRSGSSGSH